MTLNIVFCASPQFAIPALDICLQYTQNATLTVISQPDKVRTRGKKTTPTPIRQHAIKNNITTHTPHTKKEFANLISTINPDVIIVIAYGMIIPKTITDHYLCINAHASILPQYRGASPIQAALLNNDTKTGITLIKMNENLDEGDIITTQKLPIKPADTFKQLHDNLAQLTAQMIQSLLQQLVKKTPLTFTPQNHMQASYCHKISKQDCYLNPQDTITKNLAKIKAFSPKPGAYSWCNQKRIKLLNATIENDKLIPTMVQPEGKQPMTYSDFRRGNNHPLELC